MRFLISSRWMVKIAWRRRSWSRGACPADLAVKSEGGRIGHQGDVKNGQALPLCKDLGATDEHPSGADIQHLAGEEHIRPPAPLEQLAALGLDVHADVLAEEGHIRMVLPHTLPRRTRLPSSR